MGKIISIVNQKGGTGKTTTTINLGKALTLKKKKVLLIDLDAQGNLSYSLGITDFEIPVGELIKEGIFDSDAIHTREGMDVLPTDHFLSEFEFTFIKEDYPFTQLREVLEPIKAQYDYILIDCPPTVSFLTANALVASNSVLIPMQLDVLSIQGLNQIIYTVNEVKEELNPDLTIMGILGVLVDSRRHLTHEVLEHVRDNYEAPIFNNYIRANVKAAEAPSHGISILEYAPKSNSAKDYIAVANEFLKINLN